MKREKIIKIMDRIVEYSLYGLIFFIPISNAAIEIFVSLAISAFIAKKILQSKFIFRDSSISSDSLGTSQRQSLLSTHLFLLFFIIFCGLSLINSGCYLQKSLKALVFKWLEGIFIFLMAVDALSSRQRIRNVVAIFLAVGVLVAVDAFFQRFLGIDFLRKRPIMPIREGVYAITGPFKHYNGLAAYLSSVSSLAIALFLAKTKKMIYRVGLFLLIVLLGLSVLFTLSRGGWLGFLSAGLLMLFLSRKCRVILPFICIFILLAILVPWIRRKAMFTFQAGGDAYRFAIWEGAWKMIKENPFLGKGLGTFMDYFKQHTSGLGTQYAHNSFLQIWAEAGIFSLLSFLGFLISLLYSCIKAFKKSQDFILLGLICGIFGFLVHSFFDNHLYSLQLSVLFWFMLGLAVAIIKLEPDVSL
ncbi:MAG: O-antigen ligase family protein [Candidatus Omnitrophica bacterium]|nr:O-antigen ligase family protein [Candidatus Omnitrophota bacterium]